jgi:hypothetical protein
LHHSSGSFDRCKENEASVKADLQVMPELKRTPIHRNPGSDSGDEKENRFQSDRSTTKKPDWRSEVLPFNPLQPEPRFRGEAGGCRRKLSERSEFFRRPASFRNLGVSTDAGCAFFAYFLCTSKESKVLPGAPGQRRSNKSNRRKSGAMPCGYYAYRDHNQQVPISCK